MAENSTADYSTRVSVRHPITRDGFVDGGWWPRSRDLAAEVPLLLPVLWAQDRPMRRVSYNLDIWQHAPLLIRVDGHSVHLEGFHHHDPLLLSLADGPATDRMDLLVIPPETDPEAAARALSAAGVHDLRRPQELLLGSEELAG